MNKLKEYLIEKNWSNLYSSIEPYKNLYKWSWLMCKVSLLAFVIFMIGGPILLLGFKIGAVMGEMFFKACLGTIFIGLIGSTVVNIRAMILNNLELKNAKTKIIDELYSDGSKLRELLQSAIDWEVQELKGDVNADIYLNVFKAHETRDIEKFRKSMLLALTHFAKIFEIKESDLGFLMDKEAEQKRLGVAADIIRLEQKNKTTTVDEIGQFLNINHLREHMQQDVELGDKIDLSGQIQKVQITQKTVEQSKEKMQNHNFDGKESLGNKLNVNLEKMKNIEPDKEDKEDIMGNGLLGKTNQYLYHK